MRVLLDTSALLAVLVHNDDMHKKARATFELLVTVKTEFCITSYILLESLSLLQARVGLQAARRFYHDFLPIFTIHWVNAELHDKAFRRLELRGRRDLSLVDCTSFVWMEEAGILHAFAYDEHFSREGFMVFRNPEDVSDTEIDGQAKGI